MAHNISPCFFTFYKDPHQWRSDTFLSMGKRQHYWKKQQKPPRRLFYSQSKTLSINTRIAQNMCTRDEARQPHLAQCVGVGGHVSEDDEHVLAALVGKVLRSCERDARRDDALNGGVVRQVHEQHCALHAAVLLKVALEECSRLHVDTHRPEHDTELVLLPACDEFINTPESYKNNQTRNQSLMWRLNSTTW